MKTRVTVNDLQDEVALSRDTLDLLSRAVETVLDLEGECAAAVSLSLLDDAAMSGLNLRYRGIEGPTDVLAFPLDGDWPEAPGGGERLLGDIVISVARAREQAAGSLSEELVWLAVHGALHLLGYDHGDDARGETMDLRAREIIASLEAGT